MTPLLQQWILGLTAGHVAGDFLLQTSRDACRKREWAVLAKHCLILAAASYLLVGAWSAWAPFAAIFLIHGALDAAKARCRNATATGFLIDQLGHLISIVVIAFLASRDGKPLFWVGLWGEPYLKAVLLFTGAVVTTRACGFFVAVALRPLQERLRAEEAQGDAVPEETRGRKAGHNGMLIGRLERLLIFVFVLMGFPAGIGFLLGAKALFFLGKLRDSDRPLEAQYVLIGTLASFSTGTLCAWVTKILLEIPWV